MNTYVDDNFGHWEIEDEDQLEFYHQVQAESIWKRCEGCGRMVRLRPHYGLCDSCATRLEQGWDLDPPDITPQRVQKDLLSAIALEELDKAEYLLKELRTLKEQEREREREREQNVDEDEVEDEVESRPADDHDHPR